MFAYIIFTFWTTNKMTKKRNGISSSRALVKKWKQKRRENEERKLIMQEIEELFHFTRHTAQFIWSITKLCKRNSAKKKIENSVNVAQKPKWKSLDNWMRKLKTKFFCFKPQKSIVKYSDQVQSTTESTHIVGNLIFIAAIMFFFIYVFEENQKVIFTAATHIKFGKLQISCEFPIMFVANLISDSLYVHSRARTSRTWILTRQRAHMTLMTCLVTSWMLSMSGSSSIGN